MTCIVADDEHILLNHLQNIIKNIYPDANIFTFDNSESIVEFVKENKIDIAFLDINMPSMNGIELAKILHEEYPKLNIIFTTGYDTYAVKAFELNVSAYLLKPITKVAVENALNNLRYPLNSKLECKIKVQCFGDFEFFVDSKPIEFKFSKTKELLAFLIYKHGALCSNEEIISVLWEDDNDHNSYFKQLRQDLDKTLVKYNCDQILIRQRGKTAIITDLIECDYYDYLNGKNVVLREFMNQYSWGEEVTALLS